MLWEIDTSYESHNQTIAKMTKEELLERNKDFKPAPLPEPETLMKLKRQKEADIIAINNRSRVITDGPTYKVVECQKPIWSGNDLEPGLMATIFSNKD